ncbi:MAG TPA: flagellar basal body-associated FliL family protein [Spirochaetales bacterium]|nr:flagellar basal body-associated FliL family protein [Spirochaetales bacterium]HPG87484.1 flagellar basal body-associated FliL family protein [Spirochaetales bacterium]
MSDEDFDKAGPDFSDSPEVADKPKGKGGGKAILGLLKWIGIGLGAVIFIIVIVVVTVSLLNRQAKPMTTVPTSEEYQRATPIWATFTSIDQITTSTIDKEPWSVMIKLNLAYDQADKEIQTELTSRKYQIQDALRNFFSMKSIKELMPNREQELKEELREMLNRMLSKPAIKDVYFQTFSRNQM